MFPRSHNRLDKFVTTAWIVLVIGLSVTFYVAFKPVHSPYAPHNDLKLQQVDSDTPSFALPDSTDFTVIWDGEPEMPNRISPDDASGIVFSDTPNAIDFQLRGIFYWSSEKSVACLSRNGNQSLYAIGDTLGEWEVSEIDVQSVTVTRNGESRTLRMGQPMYAGSSARTRPIIHDTGAVRTVTMTRPSSGASSGQTTHKVQKKSVTSQPARPRPAKPDDVEAMVAVAANIIDQLREDPASVKLGAGFMPNLDKAGNMNGVLLNKIEPGSLAARYGLAPGDRILSINGEPISSLTRGMQLYQRYRENDSVRVTIERGGLIKNVLFYAH